MKNTSNILLKISAIVLLIAGVLKGWQLLTEPVISYNLGRLADVKEWFVTTPAVALLTDGQVTSAWEGKTVELESILAGSVRTSCNFKNSSYGKEVVPMSI